VGVAGGGRDPGMRRGLHPSQRQWDAEERKPGTGGASTVAELGRGQQGQGASVAFPFYLPGSQQLPGKCC
jgi:hypothetical protein